MKEGLFSSVAEHWSRKPGVVSSILTGGSDFFVSSCVHQSLNLMLKNLKPRKKKKNITGKFFNNYLVFQHVDLKFCMVIVFSILQEMKNNSQPTGFEPVRGDPI